MKKIIFSVFMLLVTLLCSAQHASKSKTKGLDTATVKAVYGEPQYSGATIYPAIQGEHKPLRELIGGCWKKYFDPRNDSIRIVVKPRYFMPRK